jgi:hypothetical protein
LKPDLAAQKVFTGDAGYGVGSVKLSQTVMCYSDVSDLEGIIHERAKLLLFPAHGLQLFNSSFSTQTPPDYSPKMGGYTLACTIWLSCSECDIKPKEIPTHNPLITKDR